MWAAVILCLTLLLYSPLAIADANVTLCGADDQTGAGTNLAAAMTAGGRITFACGAGATILLNCHHEIIADTQLDGGDNITLKVNSAGPGCNAPSGSIHYALFHDEPMRRLSFTLSGLTIIGEKPPPNSVTSALKGQVINGNLSLALHGSTITGAKSPIWLQQGQVLSDNGDFTDNDGVIIEAPDISILDHSQFVNNGGAPLQVDGGAVTIHDADFTGNKQVSTLTNCSGIDVQNSRFTSNTSPDAGGALSVGCDTRISNTVFTKNQARSGGALYIGDNAGKTDLVGVDFISNVATGDGGAIALRYEIFAPIPPPQILELHGVTFTGNHAQVGGALEFARGALPGVVLSDRTLIGGGVRFTNNRADTSGGALLLIRAQATLDSAMFVGNEAGTAGGAVVSLQDEDGSIQLANSLLVKNTAPAGAALVGQAADFINTTIADNAGPAVSAAGTISPFPPIGGPAGPRPIRFHNTIISGGAAAPCGPPDAAAPYQDLGNNLQYPAAACAASIAVAAPGFGPSYIPLPTSPAAQAGSDPVCAASPVGGRDIWGTVRPKGAHCAIGAAETDIQQMVSQTLSPITRAISEILACSCRKH
jgi:predicted outer membrane repeat protein